MNMIIEEAMKIPGRVEQKELVAIHQVVPKCKSIIEIGTLMGRTTKVLLDRAETVYSIDPFENPKYEATFQRFLGPEIKSGRIVVVRGYSSQVVDQIKSLVNPKDVGAVFIDADHSYQAVKDDITNYREFVPNGILCGHDAGPGFEVVIKALNETIPGWKNVGGSVWMKDLRQINFFDVGACTGDTVNLAAEAFRRAGVNYHIYAFEACPANIVQLSKLQQADPERITIVQGAIGDREGTLRLYLSLGKESHSIFSSKNNVDPTKFIDVPGIIFSKWYKQNITSAHINFMKMNIEGAEYQLIKDLDESRLYRKMNVYFYLDRFGYPIDLDKVKLTQEQKKATADRLIKFKKFGSIVGIFAGLNFGTKDNFDLEKYLKGVL